MDLFINISLVFSGAVGAVAAIGGSTWDESKGSLLVKVTRTGWLAIGCILISVFFGIVKEIRARDAAAQADQVIQQLKKDNDVLKENLFTVQNLLVRQERIEKVNFHVDAFDGEQRLGFNSLTRLAQKADPDLSITGRAIGIFFLIDYGDLEIYVAGYSKDAQERWFCKVFFQDENRAGYYETEPISIVKNTPFLIAAILSEEDLNHFWKSRPQVASVISRPPYAEDLFDPRFELGFLKIIGFGLLEHGAKPGEFAGQKLGNWFDREVDIPRSFLMDWHIVLEVNDRQIREVEQILDGTPSRAATKRLIEWHIQSKHQPKGNETLLAPVGYQWTDFFSVMNGNVRQLLYGKRDGFIKIEPRYLPPAR